MEGLVREVLAQLIAILGQFDVPYDPAIDDAALRDLEHQVATIRPEHLNPEVFAEESILAPLVKMLLPERYLDYDTERIYDGNDYIALTQMFAARTGGEWQPEQLTAAFKPDEQKGHARVRLTFSSHRYHYDWRISQWNDWVSEEFIENLAQFTSLELSGDFVRVAPGGQCDGYVYLPRSAVPYFNRLKAEVTRRVSVARRAPDQATRAVVGSVSLEDWSIFDEVGGLALLRARTDEHEWRMDAGDYRNDRQLYRYELVRQLGTASPIDWEALTKQPADGGSAALGVPDDAPIRIDLYSRDDVDLARRTLCQLELTEDHYAATVLVPFAPTPDGWWGVDIDPTDPRYEQTDNPKAWRICPTWRVFHAFQGLPAAERRYAEDVFARYRDTRVDVLDAGWFCGGFVYFARLAVQHKRPVVLRLARE